MAFTPLEQATGAKTGKSSNFSPLDSSMTALSHSQRAVDQLFARPDPANPYGISAQSGVPEGALPLAGGIAGGIGGGILGIPGGPAGVFAGGVAGAGLGGGLGQAAEQKLTGKPLDLKQVGKTGLTYGAAEAVGLPVAFGLKAIAPAVMQVAKKAVAPITNFLAKRAEKKAIDKTVSALTPKFKPSELEDAATKKGGFFTPPKVDMSKDKEFMDVATSLKGVVKGKSAIEDKNVLEQTIKQTSDETIKPFLSANPVKTYFGDFIRKLELAQPKTSFKTGTPQFENYDRVRKEITARVADYLRKLPNKGEITDMNDYWDARKMIDDVLDTETKGKVFGDPVREGAVAAGQDMRRAMQEYILDALQYPGQMEKVNVMQDVLQEMRRQGIDLPTEKEAFLQLQRQLGIENVPEDIARSAFFKDQMERLSKMYKGIEYVKTKIPDEFKKGSFIKQIVKNPAVQIGGSAAIGGGIVAGGNKLVGD